MTRRRFAGPTSRLLALLVLVPLLAACGSETNDTATTPPAASSQLLDTDLPGAVGVVASKLSDPETEVVVAGRVRNLADGVFTIVDDEAVAYCGQREDCESNCPTPWDYCCESPDRVRDATLVVEAKTADGTPVAERDMGLRPLDLVVVRGTLRADEQGTFVLDARDGWFRRDRPVTPDYVDFP